jgi:hypothetical protein
MLLRNRKASSSHPAQNWFWRIPWLLIPVLALSFTIANAQTNLTATLSGTVTDQTDARIPGAAVLVKNDASGDLRDTKADSAGYFSVTALYPGTYSLTISSKGFATWKETGILLNPGDSRTVPNIHMKISTDVTAVTVISGENAEVPVDTAEISATLNNELVDSAILTGRDAGELMKMMPGIVFNNGGSPGSAFNSMTTGTNNGPAGMFSANGTQPFGSTALILDGANLVDPGNAGTQIANINQDMTDSVKFLSASYGAEYAKGPAILEAFSKSGGQKYHGEAYIYSRNTDVGFANDWYNKQQGNPIYPQHFYYMGGNVGGPISFGSFNKAKDKLFFWAGYEYMDQHPYNAPVEMNVPTAAQDAGNFNNPGINTAMYNPLNGNGIYSAVYALPCATDDGWQGCNAVTSPWGGYGAGVPPGTVPTVPNLKAYFDPIGVNVNNINPPPNQTATSTNGWNNYGYSPSTPVDRWEATGKVTYAFNDNNKLWGSYAYQTETDNHPLSIWWAPEWTIPYPSNPSGKETARLWLVNYTHVFNASTTNEFVFSYVKFVNDCSQANPSAVTRSTVGFPSESVFGSSHLTKQIPNFKGGWDAGLTEIDEFSFDGGIYGPNSFGKTAKAPSITDNFTKIVKTHSIKAGFYWDTQENAQSSSSDYNGTFDSETWGASSTYNLTLDRLMGRIQNYTEQSSIPTPDELWHQWSLWAQDSWKATPKMTLNLGLRADHEGQWYDKLGGTQDWDPASYVNTSSPPANTGLLWNSLSPKVPKSGWASQAILWDPRLGFAYDVFGTGKTVVRGGFGTYRYQVSDNDAGWAMGGPLGSFEFSTGPQSNGFCNGYSGLLNSIQCQGGGTGTKQWTVPQGLNQDGASGVPADVEGDNKVPYANTWSFGFAQALPTHIVAQASYVASMSRNQMLNGSNGHIEDANPIAYGAFFGIDPQSGTLENPAPCQIANCTPPPPGAPAGPSALNSQDYRPLINYGDIWLQTHGGHANYNSIQIAAQKQSGNLYLFTNFTFGKVLGTRDGSTSNGNGNGPVVNPFDLNSNYGPLEYDHTKAFNVMLSYKLPKPIHDNAVLGQIVNGWELSNYTAYQDGVPYQTTSVNMNGTYNQVKNSAGFPQQTFQMPDGLYTQTIGTSEWFGTSQYENGLQEVLTCDPRKGLAKGQYFNPGCFAAPLAPSYGFYGQMGQIIWPYIRTPHYFDSDLALFKAFKVTEAQRLELRFSATNVLNHANGQFGLAGNADNQLTFSGVSTSSGLVYNSNQSTTGVPEAKLGYRWMQFAAKYYF